MRSLERTGRRGNFLVLFAISASVVLGFGALGIDISYLRNSQMELQNAVDAAAHAAMVSYRQGSSQSEARDVAKLVAANNRVAGRAVSLGTDDIIFGTWDFEGGGFSTSGSFVNAVQVVARRTEGSTDGPINYFLGPVIGTDYGEIRAEATGAFRFREMMLVLDTTGSFFRDIDNGRSAVLGFLDRIYANRLPQDKIGLSIFAQNSQVVTQLQDVQSNYSSIRSSWFGDGDRTYNCRVGSNGRTTCNYYTRTWGLNICFMDQDGDGVADTRSSSGAPTEACMRQKYLDVGQTIPNINCYDGSAYSSPKQEGTDHSVALQGAIDHILDEGLGGNQKVIVLVSDGRAQCKQPDDSSTQSCIANRQQLAYDQADRAAENNISIFSVMYCSNCDSTQLAGYEAYASALVSGVGKAYTTTDSNQLDDILAEIADSLPVALVQ